MSRTYDARGKLVNTVNYLGTAAAPPCESTEHNVTASYSYDPAGNLVGIVDKEGNTISRNTTTWAARPRWTIPTAGRGSTPGMGWAGCARRRTRGASRLRTATTTSGDREALHQGAGEQRCLDPQRELAVRPERQARHGERDARRGRRRAPERGRAGVPRGLRVRLAFCGRSARRPASLPGYLGSAQLHAELSAWDGNFGRLKGMSYPSGDVVKLNYDARGNLLGESEVLAAGQAGIPYRNVTAMTGRGQIAGQAFGNGLQETNTYDPSTGMVLAISATGLLETPPPSCATAPEVSSSPTSATSLRTSRARRRASRCVMRPEPSATTLPANLSRGRPPSATTTTTCSGSSVRIARGTA